MAAESEKKIPEKAEEPKEEAQENKKADSEKSERDMKWYVVHTYSGYEAKAKQALKDRIVSQKAEKDFDDILIPSENVIEVVKGKKKTKNKRFFPSYILVRMHLTNKTWHIVKNTPKITGFVGHTMHPPSVPDEQVRKLTSQIEEGTLRTKSAASFEAGDSVRVTDGPFANFNGVVEEVKPEKEKVRVLVSIFGRSTPVELDFSQVEKS